MTKKKSRLIALALFVVMITALVIPVQAADSTSVTALLRPDTAIVIDGETRTFYNANGEEVHPILYNGTNYLPIRAIGELMGKNVNWDQSTLTVTLSGTRTGEAVTGTPDTDAAETSVTAELRRDFTIVVEGTARTFYDANGDRVYPLLYNGSVYLPIRAIGELMGKTVSWDGTKETVYLTGSGSGNLVTDADSFSTTTGSTTTMTTTTGTAITVEEAKSAALTHAGLTAGKVTFVKQKLDYEDGRQVYDIEFYNTTTREEYDYEIDAATGEIVSFDYDAENYTQSTTTTTGTAITVEEAKSAALTHAGLTASEVTFVKQKLDYEDGRQVY
ncbi:MAG: PepSY domain-containing protein, partial [Oscillospiraceae bacterium]|nr:PepSY domain-containing protein [Oscillospiraceae bacterium]